MCVRACKSCICFSSEKERALVGGKEGRGEGEISHTLYVGEEGARSKERELGSV